MKIYYVDIDGTICNNTDGSYDKAKPITKNIDIVNSLYDAGNTIIYWTARGSVTRIDWLEFTRKQLDSWNVKYHDVRVGKPHFDLYICDKAINCDRFFGTKDV